MEWVYRGFFRAIGVRNDPILTTKRVNVVERLEEAQAFEAMLKGIKLAIEAGLSLETAFNLYEQETGMIISGEVKAALAEDVMHFTAEPKKD